MKNSRIVLLLGLASYLLLFVLIQKNIVNPVIAIALVLLNAVILYKPIADYINSRASLSAKKLSIIVTTFVWLFVSFTSGTSF